MTTDFRSWKRETLEAFARQAATEKLQLHKDLKLALAAYRAELARQTEPAPSPQQTQSKSHRR